jgi:NAD(P)-dependent dehydrogenase (short-subunit alcohol dehydrogenase family)
MKLTPLIFSLFFLSFGIFHCKALKPFKGEKVMNFYELSGKTALVTGASSGLGYRFAEILSRAGVKVICVARRMDKLKALAQKIEQQGGKALPLALDVSDKAAIFKAVKTLEDQGHKIDILINNAGIGKYTPIFGEDNNDFEMMMKTNVLGVWAITKAVANHMKKNKIQGSIINIASVNGANRLREDMTGYASSKAAVIQMTKALVGELSKENIRINCIAPGLFVTPLTESRTGQEDVRKEVVKTIPLGFVAESEELDGAILYLASNKTSKYVTGSCMTIDGGVSWGGS